jgi:hypothetical protein
MWTIIGIVVVAIALNWIVRAIIRKEYSCAIRSEADFVPPNRGDPLLQSRAVSIARKWAANASAKPHLCGPLHPELVEFLMRYPLLQPEGAVTVVDALSANAPYALNAQFVRIGTRANGSAVLANRDVSDRYIYVADIEDGDVAVPERWFESIWEYILCTAEEIDEPC